MWLANTLTLSRIPLGIFFLFIAHQPGWAIAVTLLGAFTDLIDGPIARRVRRQQGLPPGGAPGRPVLGSWLDPLCDKFFVLAVLAGTYAAKAVPLGLILAIAAREMILAPVAALYRFTPWLRARMAYDFTAGPSGKAATVAQILAITAILIDHPWRWPLGLVACGLGLFAATHYLARGIRHMRAGRVAG